MTDVTQTYDIRIDEGQLEWGSGAARVSEDEHRARTALYLDTAGRLIAETYPGSDVTHRMRPGLYGMCSRVTAHDRTVTDVWLAERRGVAGRVEELLQQAWMIACESDVHAAAEGIDALPSSAALLRGKPSFVTCSQCLEVARPVARIGSRYVCRKCIEKTAWRP